LADNEKKGTRDISDLKARLGLKKGAQGAPASTPGAGAPQASGGAPAVRAPLPAPPGFRSPEPEPAPAAAAPDPRRDPFAAAAPPANPAAYYGYAPLPGTDDGTAAAPIEKPKPWGRIITVLLSAAVALGGGFVAGSSCAARKNYNMTIDQSGEINAEVEKIQKKLNLINDRINQSQDAAHGNPDVQLAKDLGSLDLKEPDTQKIFHTNYFFLEDLAIDRLFNYYNDTGKLYRMIREHAKKTEADEEAIENFVKNSGAKGEKNYGITLNLSGAVPLANFVELGSPVCPKEGQTDCNANELKGFKYRTDSGGQWFDKPVKGKPDQTVTPLQKSALFNTVVAGNPDVLSARDHLRRMAEIRAIAQKLFNEQKELSADLKRASERPKVFTF
jgi:hypothetical protein